MKTTSKTHAILTAAILLSAAVPVCAQSGGGLRFDAGAYGTQGIHRETRSFDGYINFWKQSAWTSYAARGLFGLWQPTAESELRAMEADIGNQLLLEELWIQPGFIKELAGRSPAALASPSADEFDAALSQGDVLVALVDRDPVAQTLLAALPEEMQFRRNRAFFLRNENRVAFALICQSSEERDRLQTHVAQTVELVRAYDFHRGVAGARTNHLAITAQHRLDPFALIDEALGLGCSWVSVCGCNDWMLAGPAKAALAEIGFPFPFISGQYVSGGVIYGLERYPEVQDNTTEDALDWAEARGGYYFGSLSRAEEEEAARYDGYLLGSASDDARVNALDAPFMTRAGEMGPPGPNLDGGVLGERGDTLGGLGDGGHPG